MRHPISVQFDDGNLIAVCNDGSVWIKFLSNDRLQVTSLWQEMEPLPGSARASEQEIQKRYEESTLTIAQVVPR